MQRVRVVVKLHCRLKLAAAALRHRCSQRRTRKGRCAGLPLFETVPCPMQAEWSSGAMPSCFKARASVSHTVRTASANTRLPSMCTWAPSSDRGTRKALTSSPRAPRTGRQTGAGRALGRFRCLRAVPNRSFRAAIKGYQLFPQDRQEPLNLPPGTRHPDSPAATAPVDEQVANRPAHHTRGLCPKVRHWLCRNGSSVAGHRSGRSWGHGAWRRCNLHGFTAQSFRPSVGTPRRCA